MNVTRNFNGSLTISKDLRGNLMDNFKMTYYGYTVREAKAEFRQVFKAVEQTRLVNKR